MSLLSTKGMYGLSAMYQLFLAKSNKPLQIKEISARAEIPQNYLEQLLILLRQAGQHLVSRRRAVAAALTVRGNRFCR